MANSPATTVKRVRSSAKSVSTKAKKSTAKAVESVEVKAEIVDGNELNENLDAGLETKSSPSTLLEYTTMTNDIPTYIKDSAAQGQAYLKDASEQASAFHRNYTAASTEAADEVVKSATEINNAVFQAFDKAMQGAIAHGNSLASVRDPQDFIQKQVEYAHSSSASAVNLAQDLTKMCGQVAANFVAPFNAAYVKTTK